MGLNIDELEVKISGSSEKVEKSIDKLIAKLEALKKSVNRTSGLDKLAEKINKISASIHSITGIDKLSQMAESIGKLSSIKSPNVTKTVNSIRKLSEAYNSIGSMGNVNLESLKSSISVIVDACKPMENMGKNNFAPFLNSLKKIPEITKNLDNSKIEEFAKRIRQLTAAIEPLTSSVSKAEKGLVALNGIVKSSVASNGNLAAANAAATKSYTSLSTVLRDVRTKIISVYVGFSKTSDFLADCFQSSNEYVENVNLFTVAMGEYAEEAYNYAEQVNKLLGIDISEWIRFQGVFKQITTGFGVAADKSNLMSKNLAQIGYDIASFYNISIEESMQKIQSGISGELEPLRRLGYALDAATLQQIAYDNGITQNINTMTQAQKSQLRYIAIMQQSTNVMGDMARTIITPANSMRILQQQMEQLKRAIGNIVSVFAVKLIPYVQVLIRFLTDAANAVADWLGFELPTIDYSQAGKGLTSVTEEADNATEAVKETQDQLLALAGFDEINQLNLDKGKKDDSGDATIGNNYDLGIDLPEYDFLAGLDEQTDKLYKQIKNKLKDIYEWLKKHKKIIGTIAGILTGIWAVGKIKKFIDKVKELSIIQSITKMFENFIGAFKGSKATTFLGKLKDGFAGIRDNLNLIQKIGIGTVFGTIAGISSYDFFKKLSDKTLTWKDALKDTAFFLGSISAAFIIGGPIAGAVAIVGGLTGAFVALYKSEKDAYNELTGLYDNGGVKISDITDLFSKQYDKVIETSKKVEEYVKLISDNKGEIKTAADNISDFNKAFGTTGEYKMSEDDLEYIQTQFKKISEAIKENIGTATQGILDSFSEKIGKVAETTGTNLDILIGSLKGFESEMMSNVDEAENTVTSYWQLIYDGITPTAEQTAAYEQANGYLTDKIREQSTELSKVKEEMSTAIDFSKLQIDHSKMDFESPEIIVENIDNLTSKTKEALSAVESTYKNSMALTEELYQEAQLQYKHGLISDEAYDMATKTYNNTKSLLKADMEQSKRDIENDYATLTGAIQSQIDESVRSSAEYWAGVDAGLWKKGEEINYEALENYKKNNSAYWQELLKDQQWKAEHNMKELRYTLQKNADEIDIQPNPKAGKAWLEQIGENGKLVLPSVISECNSLTDLWNQNNIKHMGYNIEKFGLKTSDMYKSTATKNFDDYNNTFVGKSTAISSTLDTFGKKISEQLSKVDLQVPAINTVNNFSSALSGGIKRTKPAIVNSFVGVYNEILNRTDTFNVKLMDTFNSAIPHFQSMGNTLASLAGSASMQINGINYTAPGYRVKGYDGEYASGGFPKKHELFIARENGIPEMVGRIGNQTAVANNDQITEAIFKAVYRAMSESGSNNNSGEGGDTYVFIDSDEIAARIERRQSTRNKRTGGRI